MARSWEYSPRRRVAMQVAMWVILGLTLGLAGLVSKQRMQSRRVTLGAPTVAGDLAIRLPQGWRFHTAPADDGWTLRGRESARDNHGLGRAIDITEERLGKSAMDAEAYLSANVAGAAGRMHAMKFGGMNSDGVLAELDKPGEQGAEGDAPPGLYACTVVALPDGEPLAVVIILEDVPPFPSADSELVQEVANGMTLAPSKAGLQTR